MKNGINKMLLIGAASLMLASCVEDINIFGSSESDTKQLSFTATMDEQDWYGVKATTRSVANQADEVIPTNYVTEKGKHVNIISHETYGISGERVKIGGKPDTRAIVTQSIDTRKLSISQFGFTNSTGGNINVSLLNKPAVTTDGQEWSCNEFFVNRNDYTAVRLFGALFPYNEDYTIKADDYENTHEMVGSLRWMNQFRVDYKLASDSAHLQEDLLYAKQIRKFTGESFASDGPTPLVFRHAMTAVKVKLGPSGFVPAIIKQVRLKNVHSSGTLHFFNRYNGQTEEDMVNTSGYWDVNDTITDCVAITNFDTQGEYNCYVTGDAATFMMIPQQLPKEAMLELDIVFASDYEEKVVTITAPIGDPGNGNPKYWNIGTTHEYIIDTKENVDGYYMVMEGINQSERAKYVDANGGDASITLKSYKSDDKSAAKYAPLKWQYIGYSLDGEYYEDDDADWLHMSLTDGTPIVSGTIVDGSITGQQINIKIDGMPEESGVDHAEILRSRPAKGSISDGAYDLSRHKFGSDENIATTTANSYVIDAPGHYTFPTVYGNALVNGAANPKAYGLKSATTLGTDPSSTSFVDYLDRQIASPQIQYNVKLKRAALLWEDAPGLVTDVKLAQRGDFVEFRVERDNIDQGNAVIAVYDEHNRVVWSWHIWVTDEDINATVATGSGKYQAMPVNLGWKSVSKANAVRGREIYLHFAQGENDDEFMNYETVIRVTQRSDYKTDGGENKLGSSPYYQWGRKDPLVGAYKGKSIDVYTYGSKSFYCESLTTWKTGEGFSIFNKCVEFAIGVAAGIATATVTVGTGGIGAAAAVGIAAATATVTGFVNMGLTKMEEALFATTDQWGATIGYAIQNPLCDIKSAMTWTECKRHDPYHDLWGYGQNTDNQKMKVVKTIYDPCPVGFHVPEGDAFFGLDKVPFSGGVKKGNFYLPACGTRIDYFHDRSMEGGFDIMLGQVGSACGYWTAAPCKESKNDNQYDDEWYRGSEGAFAFVADDDRTGLTRGSYEAWGYSMRPIADY